MKQQVSVVRRRPFFRHWRLLTNAPAHCRGVLLPTSQNQPTKSQKTSYWPATPTTRRVTRPSKITFSTSKMSALETTLEWPRFCYSGPSMFEETSKPLKKAAAAKKRKSPKQQAKRSSSGTTTDSLSDGESSIKDEQMVPTGMLQEAKENLGEFAFSDLMRRMAQKYQLQDSDSKDMPRRNLQPSVVQPPLNSQSAAGGFADAFSAALSHYLPTFPPIFHHFSPPPQLAALDTLAGSRALSALAAQKRPFSDQAEEIMEVKRRKLEDPLDLSPTGKDCDSDGEDNHVDVLSIDPPPASPSDVEQWSVATVCEFVSNVDTCQEYVEVFREHSIDGSALLELNENHLTRILGLKLGPAIRIKNAIHELRRITTSETFCITN